MKKINFIKVVLLIFLSNFSLFSAEEKVRQISPEMLKEIIGNKIEMEFVAKPFPHMEIHDTKKPEKTAAYLFNSADLGVSAKGHGGPVDCNVLISPDGTVISVIVGDNKETPKYLKRVIASKQFKEWKGKKVNDEAPETLSGATKTSNAINQSVKAILEKLSEKNFFE